MKIDLVDIFNHKYNQDVPGNSGLIFEVDTDTFEHRFDVVALIHRGREVICAYPAVFVDGTTDIVVIDPNRTRDQNYANRIVTNHIHDIDGVRFTCVTRNLRRERIETGCKYHDRDNWL